MCASFTSSPTYTQVRTEVLQSCLPTHPVYRALHTPVTTCVPSPRRRSSPLRGSHTQLPHITQYPERERTRIRRVFWAPGQPVIIPLGSLLHSPSASRHRAVRKPKRLSFMWRKTELHGRQTTQQLCVTRHMCEHVRGVVTPWDVANGNGVCFNSSVCPKLLRGQMFHSPTAMPEQHTFTRVCVNMQRYGCNAKRAQRLLHDDL